MKTRKGFTNYRKDYPQLRYGQAFVNYFGVISFPEMAYLSNEDAQKIGEKLMNDWHLPEGECK